MGRNKISLLKNLLFTIAIVLLSGGVYLLVENNGIGVEKIADSVPFINGLLKRLVDLLITSTFQ